MPPENIERFINFLSPNASQKNAFRINFKDLGDVNVKSTGLFGTKEQLCDMLQKLDLADKNLYVVFVSCCFDVLLFELLYDCDRVCVCSCRAVLDKEREEELLKPGIHAIMSIDESDHPTTLKAQNRDEKPLCKIGLIYWPVDDAFEVAPAGVGDFGIRRGNVSCLYLRILHEITDCVVLPVSSSEVEFCFVYMCLILMFCPQEKSKTNYMSGRVRFSHLVQQRRKTTTYQTVTIVKILWISMMKQSLLE